MAGGPPIATDASGGHGRADVDLAPGTRADGLARSADLGTPTHGVAWHVLGARLVWPGPRVLAGALFVDGSLHRAQYHRAASPYRYCMQVTTDQLRGDEELVLRDPVHQQSTPVRLPSEDKVDHLQAKLHGTSGSSCKDLSGRVAELDVWPPGRASSWRL